MKASILFPSDYFSLQDPSDTYAQEFQAVNQINGLEAALFNYDEFIEGKPVSLSKPAAELPSLLIYRGWMMKPNQYQRFYEKLLALGFTPLVTPLHYEQMHCFPNVASIFADKTPTFAVFPERGGTVSVDADFINKAFHRFMIKDYVKSVKNTDFPTFIETPVSQPELNARINDFIKKRGNLFTGGIVLKEYLDLKKYEGATNEWREFVFAGGVRLGLNRNSAQPATSPAPPEVLTSARSGIDAPFFTVDYAELADGNWIVIEAGDGQVSGLAESDSPLRFYQVLADLLAGSFYSALT